MIRIPPARMQRIMQGCRRSFTVSSYTLDNGDGLVVLRTESPSLRDPDMCVVVQTAGPSSAQGYVNALQDWLGGLCSSLTCHMHEDAPPPPDLRAALDAAVDLDGVITQLDAGEACTARSTRTCRRSNGH